MCVRNPASGRAEELEMLADTDSWYVALPKLVAGRLGLKSVGREVSRLLMVKSLMLTWRLFM